MSMSRLQYFLNYNDVYVCSDIHGFHTNIAIGSSNWSDKSGCRPFANEIEMTEHIVDKINSKVPENGVLIHLGDWTFGGYDNVGKLRNMIKCKNVFNCFGNHDHHIEKNRELRDLFVDTFHYTELKYMGRTLVLCHYPIESWNKIHRGSMMLHGHCHHSLPEHPGRRIDLGLEGKGYDYSPLHIEDVIDRMLAKPIIQVDHHGPETS